MINSTRVFAATAMLLAAAGTQAATINFSSLETVLVDPMDMNSKMTALWTGWATQVYEYNMPFIELENESDAPFAIDEYRMTIGNTNYQFSNAFFRKEETNSYPYPANGEYAITGFSTPGVDFTTSVEDGGDTLVIKFADGGLKPGETVRFQVDIDRDDDVGGMMLFADYTSVFFDTSGDNSPAAIADNSKITLSFVGTDLTSMLTVPNYEVSAAVQGFLHTPRPYQIMQPIDVYPNTPFGEVPEPTAALLAVAGLASVAARRRV